MERGEGINTVSMDMRNQATFTYHYIHIYTHHYKTKGRNTL